MLNELTRHILLPDLGFFGPDDQKKLWEHLRRELKAGQTHAIRQRLAILNELLEKIQKIRASNYSSIEEVRREQAAMATAICRERALGGEKAVQALVDEINNLEVDYEKVRHLYPQLELAVERQSNLVRYALNQYSMRGSLRKWEELPFVSKTSTGKQLSNIAKKHLKVIDEVLRQDDSIASYNELQGKLDDKNMGCSGKSAVRTVLENFKALGQSPTKGNFASFKHIVRKLTEEGFDFEEQSERS